MTTQTTTPRRNRKPLTPVCGKVRLLMPVGTVGPARNHVGEIEITAQTSRGPVTHAYLVRVCSGCYQLHGYDMVRRQPTHYDIAPDFSCCDCADATYREDREGGCKHRRALAALVAAGKLPAIAGPVEDKTARGDEDFIGDEEANYLASDRGWYDAQWDAV